MQITWYSKNEVAYVIQLRILKYSIKGQNKIIQVDLNIITESFQERQREIWGQN
jgi:hypothetical protein